jgi:hypothetical protein
VANEELERQLQENRRRLLSLQHEVLPDLFTEAQIKTVTVDAEGNYPAFTARLGPYYKASIAAEWPDERREAAFAALQQAGGADLIRTVITVELDPGKLALAERLERGLRSMGVDFRRQLSVHWRTLTSFVQEQYEAKPPRPLPLEALGATVGRRVSIKQESTRWRR